MSINQKKYHYKCHLLPKTLDRSEDGAQSITSRKTLQKNPYLFYGLLQDVRLSRLDPIDSRIDRKRQPEFYRCQHISIHRWAEIESTTQIMDVFGIEENNSNYSPWPIIIPSESDMIVDFTTGLTTDFTIYEGSTILALQLSN